MGNYKPQEFLEMIGVSVKRLIEHHLIDVIIHINNMPTLKGL